jgi:hypothetical protein
MVIFCGSPHLKKKTGNRPSEEDGKGANTDTERTLKFHIASLSSKTLTLFKYFN